MSDITQEEYYDIETIESRLSEELGTDSWENIKKTDLGKALLRFGANVVHLDAMAFFTGLDQFFKSTVTMSGYLEEIAKSQGVIPETYVSANITVSIYSLSGSRSYGPMDLSFTYGGTKFYNITDIIIGDVSDPSTIVLYEGEAVRQASEAGQGSGNLWSYSQLRSPVSVKVGDKVIRRYQVVPKEAYVDSIIVETSQSFLIPFTRWQKVSTWYNVTSTARDWLLGKDYLGRYKVEFGDGVYGRIYPTDEIIGIRYLLSAGDGIEVDDLTAFKIYYQDQTEISAVFNVLSVSDLVDGTSEVDESDLHLKIEGAQTTRDALIKEDDYKNYLESRADVKSATVVAERSSDPPNIEMFNTVQYAIKPNAEGGSFNNASIQAYFRTYGLDTVEFNNAAFEYKGFNVIVGFTVDEGYSSSSISTLISSTLAAEFTWSNLGFDERITSARVYELIKDIEGLDLTTLTVTIQSAVMETETGLTEFNIALNEVIDLSFYPKRFKIYGSSDDMVSGTTARDSGDVGFYADITDRELFNHSGLNVQKKTLNIENMLFMYGSGTTRSRVVELRQDEGGVNSAWFDKASTLTTDIIANCYIDRYSEIGNLELVGGVYYLRTYQFSDTFFDATGFDYLQLEDEFESLSYRTKSQAITPPTGATDASGMIYYNSYLYILWNVSGNDKLVRYRITQTTIDTEDADYNAVGYLELGDKTYRNMVMTESIFTDESVLWIASDDGIDAARQFDDGDDVYYEPDFFGSVFVFPAYAPPIDWRSLTSDGSSLYGVRVVGTQHVVTKLYSLSELGTCQVKALTDDSLDNIVNVSYDSYEGRVRIYFYDASEFKLFYVGYDDTDQVPLERAGSTSGEVESIQQVGVINHSLRQIQFSRAMTNASIWFESEEEIAYTTFEMASAVDLTVTYNG